MMGLHRFRLGRFGNEDNAANVKVVRRKLQRSKNLNANDSIYDYALAA